MPKIIKLSKSLLSSAQSASEQSNRTLSEQIEYWARLGRAAEENPELPVQMLQDILVSIEEVRMDTLNSYAFRP
ncbi:ParD-like family protein [Polynucleobacter sp. MWH-Braz-FAM2G]|uniref:ParD-like family protein n=1 Tax=Polynucleobacter sp. MWH-Braz-FAM2G TaxID=1855883 RepID=UPI001BFD6040|nr:ParD-like family protein [Polynucleobacter sp. MWH-Braz-FAM2G]QWD91452.1 hypothetical protein FD973_03730 [Polynucleobacter sp. MWH-Braz-FAM2G]